MRMWMLPPEFLCRKHLLGEHVEIHMFAGHIKRRRSVTGYIRNNLLEPLSINMRHEILVGELLKREYNHKSALNRILVKNLYYMGDHRNYRIDVLQALKDLVNRCKECKLQIFSDNTYWARQEFTRKYCKETITNFY